MEPAALDAPYDRLAALPRAVWLHGVITSAGERAARLADMARWFAALDAGQLPPAEADFGDPAATAPLRAVVAGKVTVLALFLAEEGAPPGAQDGLAELKDAYRDFGEGLARPGPRWVENAKPD